MEYQLRPTQADDASAIIEIFNYYVKNSMAAFPENELPHTAFDTIFNPQAILSSVTAVSYQAEIIGFGLLRPYHKFSVFSRTAEVSYFLSPRFTGLGIGTAILEYLLSAAKAAAIECILAGISSENNSSISFHQKHGFKKCGQFEKIGKKNGRYFDVIWMQKNI